MLTITKLMCFFDKQTVGLNLSELKPSISRISINIIYVFKNE